MSADNTIAILQTNDGFRVEHLQAIDNLHWNEEKEEVDVSYLNMEILWEFFHDSPFFATQEDALEYASKLEKEIGYVEYGIQQLNFFELDFPSKPPITEEEPELEDDFFPCETEEPGYFNEEEDNE